MHRFASLAALVGALASPSAHACGGFFCNNNQPVVQNAERIAFGIGPRGTVEAHVQIFYTGPSEEFAWIVPVPANPDIFLSTDALFSTLAFQTAPQFQLQFREEGNCREPLRLGWRNEMAMNDSAEVASSTATDFGGVDVIQQGQVGPYDMVVLQGSDSAELLGWLVDNGYDLAPGVEPLLAPYVADDAHFLALKLSKDKDAGDIAPIGFRYPGDKPAVPIQLTSVAAAPDMRLEAYVFGDHRVVPESYLHVRINEAAVDWWSFGSNYPDVITKAANEAGGHAFATDFAGDPSFLAGQLYRDDRFDLERLGTITDFPWFVDEIQAQGWPATGQLQNALMSCVDAPLTVSAQDFLNCPDCYSWDRSSFDPAVCVEILDEMVVEPLRTAEALFAHRWVSRMTSSLDAVEMTVDPVFVENPDMGEVSNVHSADWVWMCEGGKRRSKALRRLELSDGREILLPSEDWLAENGMTEFEFIEELGDINAAIIEETGNSGQPSVLTDWTDDLFAQAEAHNQRVLGLAGCGGCSSTGSTGGLWLVGLAALGIGRRRRGGREV